MRNLTGPSSVEPTGPPSPVGYERHYGFREPPFTLTANPRFIFDSRAYAGVVDAVTRALERHEPLLVVTGPPGSGKTLVCRTVTGWRDGRTFVALIPTPPASVRDLLRLVLDQFGVLPRDSRRSAEASDFELTLALERFSASLGWFSARAVILVDEAHRLSKEVFEGLRSLINLETDTEKLLPIVLLGEPRLAGMLTDPELAQLNQRVTRRYELGPLLPEEVRGYIERRLSVAQGERVAASTVLSTEAIAAIRTLSRRVPRVINLLCDRSLETAHSLGLSPVNLAVVLAVAESLNLPIPPTLRLKRQRAKLAVAVVVLLAAASLGYWLNARGRRQEPSPPSQSRAAAPRPIDLVVDSASSTSVAANPVPAAPPEPVAARTGPATVPPGAGVLVPEPQESASALRPPAGSAGFIVVASSFLVDWRASALSERVSSELGLPVRVRTVSGWHQVVVGPYLTREEAEGAREQLKKVDVAEALVVANVVRASVATTPEASEKVSLQERDGLVAPTIGVEPTSQPETDLLERGRSLAQAGDVRVLLRLRESAESQLLREGRAAADVAEMVKELDVLLEEARRRRLQLDAEALGTRR